MAGMEAAGRDERGSLRTHALAAVRAVGRDPILWAGLAAIALTTLVGLVRRGWDSDLSSHAPIVMATAAWLFWRQAGAARMIARPGHAWVTGTALAASLVLWLAARITGLLEVQAFATYCALVATLFGLAGARVLALLWFPLVYSLFLVPIPQSFVDIATQPIKIAISDWAVSLLGAFGLPVARSGVTIYIGQFELLIAEACAGLNSLISLSAVGMFYVYLRHDASWRYTALLMVAIFPIAVFANFLRVVILILLTYYAGEATAQGFLHDFAGLALFVIALATVFLVDRALMAVVGWRKRRA